MCAWTTRGIIVLVTFKWRDFAIKNKKAIIHGDLYWCGDLFWCGITGDSFELRRLEFGTETVATLCCRHFNLLLFVLDNSSSPFEQFESLSRHVMHRDTWVYPFHHPVGGTEVVVSREIQRYKGLRRRPDQIMDVSHRVLDKHPTQVQQTGQTTWEMG